MICKCIEILKGKLVEHNYEDARLKNTAFTLPTKEKNKMGYVLNIPFLYKKKKKNGEYMKNDQEIPVRASYCPFCGKKLKEME